MDPQRRKELQKQALEGGTLHEAKNAPYWPLVEEYFKLRRNEAMNGLLDCGAEELKAFQAQHEEIDRFFTWVDRKIKAGVVAKEQLDSEPSG